MKTLFKFLFTSLIITFVVIVIALLAAPYLVTQEKVVTFLEKHIKLPDNKTIKLATPVEFGFFPYAHFGTDKADIISENGMKQTIKNLLFGFDFNDLITKNIDFDLQATYQGVDYKANVALENYSNFISNEPTAINIVFEQPVPLKLVGDLKVDGTKKQLKNFTLTHKKTVAKGDLEFESRPENSQFIKGDITLDTKNIENLRRLLDYKKYNDSFDLTSGKGKIIASFATLGSNPDEYKRNLNAEGSLKVTDAAIYGLDLEEFLQTFGQVEFAEDKSKSIPIDMIDGSFIVGSGEAKIINLNAVNKYAKAKANGKINIIKETTVTDIDIDAKISSGSVNLPLQVTGPLKDPKIRAKAINAVINNTNKLRGLVNEIKDDKVKGTIDSVFDVLETMGNSR